MSFAFAVYGAIWMALLTVSWHPLGMVGWVAWTVFPFLLADRQCLP